MPYELCEKVRELEPYEPIKGSFRIRLDANESFYNMPDEIKDEIKAIIDETDFNRYPDPLAEELINAFADYYGISAENVTATNGSDEMLYLLASGLIKRGSRVVTADPDFSMYAFYSYLSENQIETYRKTDLEINIDELISFVNEKKADMLIFSNPCNPTGRGITADEARKLVNAVGDCLVVLDEAYMDFWNESILNEADRYDNLIVLKTASKAVGAASLRLGFAIANKRITKALRAIKSPYNVNTLSQKIGKCIFSHKGLLKARKEEIIKNTASLQKGIRKLADNYSLPFKIYSSNANFVFVETDKAKDIFDYLLENSIAVRYFGKYDALRITSGSEEENTALLVQLEQYIIKNILKRNR